MKQKSKVSDFSQQIMDIATELMLFDEFPDPGKALAEAIKIWTNRQLLCVNCQHPSKDHMKGSRKCLFGPGKWKKHG